MSSLPPNVWQSFLLVSQTSCSVYEGPHNVIPFAANKSSALCVARTMYSSRSSSVSSCGTLSKDGCRQRLGCFLLARSCGLISVVQLTKWTMVNTRSMAGLPCRKRRERTDTQHAAGVKARFLGDGRLCDEEGKKTERQCVSNAILCCGNLEPLSCRGSTDKAKL